MRSWNEFMMWNHIFIFMEVLHSIYKNNWCLVILGALATILSSSRHLHHEKKYNLIEPIVAKSCLVYNTYISLTTFTFYQNMILLSSKGTIITVWFFETYDYETIHPWLHILVSIDTHLFLSYI